MGIFKKKASPGSEPVVQSVPILYYALPRTVQDGWTYPWPTAVTQYGQKVTNAWWGNQLPGYTNYIPDVNVSFNTTRGYPRSLQLTKNVNYNQGYNIQTINQAAADILTQRQGTAWNGTYGLWQVGER